MSDFSNKPLILGLAGFGTVGSGFVQVLEMNRELIFQRTGREIVIKKILVRDPHRKREGIPQGAVICTDMHLLVNDPDIDVIVEMMGGLETAKHLITLALEADKHVVTANKSLLAEDGEDLFRLAKIRGLHLGYEASVCGGIPIIQTLQEGLAANKMNAISGILNGTCNYILSAMTSKGLPFNQALQQAQELGFAEADPTLDIGGFDTAHKLILLIRLGWGVHYPYHQLSITGISGVAPEDIQFAREFGYNIKLLGYARLDGDSIEAGVFPTLVPKNFLLARVGHSYNGVRIEGNAVGAIFLHGRGAGDLPTGSAVAADVLNIARGRLPNNTGYIHSSLPQAKIMSPQEARSCYYFRLMVADKPGVLRDVSAAMADHKISIAQAIQKGQKDTVPLMFMTHETKARNVSDALEQLKQSGLLLTDPVHYRVLPDTNTQE